MANNDNQTSKKVAMEAQQRREFLEKFGKLAMVTPVALTTLMSPQTSAAPKSCKNQGSNGRGCR